MSNELKLEHLGQELHEIGNGISNWDYKLSALGRLRSTPMTPIEELEINRELKRLRARKREIEAEQVAIYDQMERDQTQHRANEKAPQGEIKREGQAELAALFDPVGIPQLEKMFPCEKWKRWGSKAKEKGLHVARTGRGKYNPYLAALWWIEKQEPTGWDIARINRTLANNLPARSRDFKSLLTGELE